MPMAEISPEIGQIVSLGPDVVVDHVQHHGQSALVTRVDQPLQLSRAAIRILHGKRIDAVVAPIAAAGKLRHRHQFDRGHAQVDQAVQLGRSRRQTFRWAKTCRRAAHRAR